MLQEQPKMVQENLEFVREVDLIGKGAKRGMCSLRNVESDPPISPSSLVHSI